MRSEREGRCGRNIAVVEIVSIGREVTVVVRNAIP